MPLKKTRIFATPLAPKAAIFMIHSDNEIEAATIGFR
jgi:hypothetical protein